MPGPAVDAPLVRTPDVLWRRLPDAVMVLPTDAGQPLTIDGAGPELWDLLSRPHTRAELATELAARHRTRVETVAADLRPVIDELVSAGALTAVSEPQA